FFNSLNVKGLKNIFVLIPPKALVKNFETHAGIYRTRLEYSAKESAELVELRDWLLPMLMNGQITFKEK
ncbi:restriction endonuclease subunit S, partial [Acinetobacter baumannii]|uniref:hypothetical protein n=1 Tax=Acinetobacter baumannii TaxID=470 RepID=UPI000DE7215E